MASLGSELTQRMVIYKWVSFSDELGFMDSVPEFQKLKDKPDIQNLKEMSVLGYVYVDHDVGISLQVEGLYLLERDPPVKIDTNIGMKRGSVAVKFRFDVIKMLDLHVLGDEERRRLSLPESPEWIHFYESPELKVIRDCAVLDSLRAEGYFDDVRSIIPGTVIRDSRSDESMTLNPEMVWVRLEEYYPTDKRFKGVLLNQPFQEFGLKERDVVSLRPVKMNEELMLIVGE